MVEPVPICQINANKVTWHCFYFPQSIPSLHWVIRTRIIENTRGSKNCPNEWLFCLAYYLMGSYPNHMTHGLFLSHDVIVTYIIKCLMSALYTILISQKWANIGAVFWATVQVQVEVKSAMGYPSWPLAVPLTLIHPYPYPSFSGMGIHR